MKIAYGDDDDQKSFQETQGLIQAYPNLKGIISPTTVGVAAAARYLSTSPQKGKIKLTGLGFPNQMRKYVKDGTVDEFQLWVPKDVGYLAGQAAAALVAGPHHRQGGREVQGRASRRVHDRRQRRDRARPADDVQGGQHRRLRLLSRHRMERARRGLRDRPGGLLAAVRRAQGAHRGLPAARRGARRRARRRRRVGRPRRHASRPAREAGDRFAAAAGRPGALPRGDLRDLEHGAAGRCRPPRCRCVLLGLQPTRASTTRTSTPASGSPTARPAACRSSPARSRARGIPYDTVAGTIDDDERAWAKIGAWVRAAGAARALRRSRIGFLGHTYPGMLDMYSDFTTVHAQIGAHVEVLEIDDLGARVAAAERRRGRGEGRARSATMFDVRRPVGRPDRRPDRGRRSSTGRRASRSASTRSSPTSSSTR